jgi:glutaminyl-peptide cyclotransferase
MRRVLLALLLATIAVADAAPRFDGQAAWRHLERLVALGPRPSGSAALVRARRYIVDELTRAGLRIRLSPFEARTPVGPIKMSNVITVIPGKRPDVILVGGHYDTKFFAEFAFVGANDGGSSTALLIELARRLAGTPREFTYWVVFFDGEEARVSWSPTDSLYGSRHLVAELRATGELKRLRSVIVVDMIGDRRLGIRREGSSTRWLTDLIWASARRLGHGAHFLAEELGVEDDHLPFLQAGVPSVLLIDVDYPPWHSPDDTLRHLSPRSLQVVGEVLLDALPALEAALAGNGAGGSE